MKNEAQEYRDMAKALRETADAADKLADMEEQGGATQEQEEAALKDFLWGLVKLQNLTK